MSSYGLRFAMTALALAALAACSGELASPIDPTVAGRYELVRINGSALPVTRALNEVVDSGFIEFETTPMTFRSEIHITSQPPEAPAMTGASVGSGIWIQYESGLRLSYVGASRTLNAPVTGQRITIEADGGTFVFSR